MQKIRFTILTLLGLLVAAPAKAVCPICTVAVIGGLGLTRYFGIDDTISGLWIGGITASLTFWTIDWLNRKKYWLFKGRNWLIALGYYLMVVVPLVWTDVVGHPLNKFWGVDKLLLGIIAGSAFFIGGHYLYEYLKKKNNGRAHFPFQKVVMPISPLIILSVIFYFLTK